MPVQLPVFQPHQKSTIESLIKRGPIVDAKLEGRGISGWCYWNSDAYVAANGGTVVHGWQLLLQNPLYIQLVHHAIVRTKDGELIDVTAAPPSVRHAGISPFIEDAMIAPARDYPAFIANHFYPLTDDVMGLLALAALKKADERRLEAERGIIAIGKSHNIPWNPKSVFNLPKSPELIALLREKEKAQSDDSHAYRSCEAWCVRQLAIRDLERRNAPKR